MLRIPDVPRFLRGACASLLLSVALPALPPQASAQELLDRVVAVVNSDVVTRIDLDRELDIATQTLRRQGTPLPARDVLERQMLERLVTKSVLTQFARQSGIRVSEADIDAAVERIASENKLDVPALRAAVERDGVAFERFREDLRGEILLARLRDREVDSRVTVTDAEIQSFVRAQEAQGKARIMVKDFGAGIHPDHLKQIFDPFFTTKGSGAGLGLSIVRSIVEENDGEIWVESVPGEKTIFFVVLPAGGSGAPAYRPAETIAAEGRG